jgi:hypothetical protein
MRGKVREVVPPPDDAGLEELVASEPTAEAVATASDAPVTAERAPTAADLGPNGDVVIDLLGRAERLTAEEARSLERETGWRWGFVGLATTVIAPVASMPVARALALSRGRADGRADAIAALDRMVAAIARNRPRTRGRAVLTAAIANAGLAVLIRDLIDQETFEVLFGPWREVMHH